MDDALINKLNMTIPEMDLTVRSNNCLESASVATVADLVVKTEAELLAVRSFGKTSLREIVKRLEEMGLSLGMRLPEGYTPPEAAYVG